MSHSPFQNSSTASSDSPAVRNNPSNIGITLGAFSLELPPTREATGRTILFALCLLIIARPPADQWWLTVGFGLCALLWTATLYLLAPRSDLFGPPLSAFGDGLLLGVALAMSNINATVLAMIAVVAFAHGLRLGWRGGLLAIIAPLGAIAVVVFPQPLNPLPLSEAIAAFALLIAGLSGALLAGPREPLVSEDATSPDWEDIVATLAPSLAAIDPVTQAQEAAMASRRLLRAAGAVVGLVDPDRREIRLVAEGEWLPESLSAPSVGARALATGSPQLNRSGVGVARLPSWAIGLRVRDFWALPFIVQGEAVGVLYLWDEEDAPSLPSDLGWFLPAVGLLAVSLRNGLRVKQMLTQGAQLSSQLAQSRPKTIDDVEAEPVQRQVSGMEYAPVRRGVAQPPSPEETPIEHASQRNDPVRAAVARPYIDEEGRVESVRSGTGYEPADLGGAQEQFVRPDRLLEQRPSRGEYAPVPRDAPKGQWRDADHAVETPPARRDPHAARRDFVQGAPTRYQDDESPPQPRYQAPPNVPPRLDGELARRPPKQDLVIGELRIDGTHVQVSLRGNLVTCSPLEFELLYALAERAGTSLSQEELLRRVWGEGYPGGIGVVEVTVHRLRRRLADGRNGPPRILTVRGEGYMLVDPRRFPYAAYRSGSVSTSR